MPIDALAVEDGENRGDHDAGRHNEHVAFAKNIRKSQVENVVGHEYLQSSGENEVGKQHQVQRLVLAQRARFEAVEHACEISPRLPAFGGRIPHEGEHDDAERDHRAADDEEEEGVIVGNRAVGPHDHEKHRTAEHREHRKQRHGGVHALDLAAVLFGGDIGYPRVEARIVCEASEEGHDAIEDDGKRNAEGHRRRRSARERNRYGLQVGEHDDRNTPEDRADADERFALSDAIGPCAHEEGGCRGGESRSGNHECDIGKRCVEHILDEQVEEVVLERPGHLSDERQQYDEQPCFLRKARLRRRLLLRTLPRRRVGCVFGRGGSEGEG